MTTPGRSQTSSSTSALLGTPLPPRERSTGAPSPSPSILTRHTKMSNGVHSKASPFGSGGARALGNSPFKSAAREDGSPQKASVAPSSTLGSPTHTATPSFAGSNYGGGDTSIIEYEQARRAPPLTRILADPSIATTFRREDDPELYDLFLR